MEEPPHKISLAFAIGTFIGFSSTFGLHTISALAAARLLKINLAVMIAGTLVNIPWTVIFIYGTCICFGGFVLGNSESCYPHGLSNVELLYRGNDFGQHSGFEKLFCSVSGFNNS